MIIRAWHLPGLADEDVTEWDERVAGGAVLRMPRLTPAQVTGAMQGIRQARSRLHARSVDSIIDVIDSVARRLLDRGDPLREAAELALPSLTGYSRPMIEHVLDGMAADWRRPALERLLEADLGGAEVLDRPVERHGRRLMATPYPVVLHVLAGNIPGVGVTSLVRALLVRAGSFGKLAAGEPLLPVLFARAVAEQDTAIGDAMAVAYWPGGDVAIEETAFREADAIVVYGGARALTEVRHRAPPHVPVLDHGPRLSIGFVAHDALADHGTVAVLAQDVARAVATFDQQGCVSPHAIYMEDQAGNAGGDAARFAGLMVEALGDMEHELPRGTLSPDEAAAVREARTRAEFGQYAGGTTELLSAPDAPFSVILHRDAGFEPSCLQRTIHVHAVRSIDDALAALRSHRPLLQSAAVAGADDALLRRIAQSGFTRITSFAQMAWPDPAGPHDGRGPLTELVRLVSVEIS